MKFPLTWLREWVNPNVSDADLAQSLTMAGLEVDSIAPVAPYFESVVVGKVLECEKHPDADKLKVCKVDIGESENLQIICGAKNIRTDLKVIVAIIGAQLPNGLKIKKAKLRGVESFGMICSEAELGLVDLSEGIAQLSKDAIIGQNIRQHLALDDNIIELDITPNRGDCFSILGVAREVCANYDLSLTLPDYPSEHSGNLTVKTQVQNPKACPKYLTQAIANIDNTVATPQWMARKLTRCGQSLHSPVVDITNFVLLELGQPMHAFDLSKINGNISVRMANTGEEITLLNEQTTKLNNNTLVIADEDSVLAIAGIMGGVESSTQADSTDILLESAFFEPVSIAGKAREYALHTESSLRFERGVDFNITKLAINRAVALIIEICGGQASKINECVDTASLPKSPLITITQKTIQKVLGFEMDANWIEAKFKSLDFEISAKDDKSWTIIPPSFRFDIGIAADLIEELARLYGYDKLPVQKLSLDANISTTPQTLVSQNQLAQSLVNRGYQEVITYSFISDEYQNLISPNAPKITLKNPISADLSVMRSSLWAGLLQSVESNQRRGHNNARFFEIGMCFDGIEADKQTQKIAGLVSGNRFEDQWAVDSHALDFFDAKADLESLLSLCSQTFVFAQDEHPALQKGQTAAILSNGKSIGWLGVLSPSVQKQLSLPKCYLFELDLANIQHKNIVEYQAFSAYQKVSRDIALVLDEAVIANDLIISIKALKQTDLVDIRLFDVYTGENIEAGKKSIALNLSYQSLDKTLSDDEVNMQISQVLKLMQTKFLAVLR